MQKENLDLLMKLQDIGLSKNESIIYIELLSNGEISANDLAKKISFDRTLCYQLLNKLIEKGLIQSYVKQNKKIFNITETKDLLRPIKKKEEQAEELIVALEKLKSKTIKEEQNLFNAFFLKVKIYHLFESLSSKIVDFLSDLTSFKLPISSCAVF